MRLTHRDLYLLVRMLPDLYACHEPRELLERSLQLVSSLIPSDNAAWGEVTIAIRPVTPSFWFDREHIVTPELLPRIGQYGFLHPFGAHFAAQRNAGAVRLSDLSERRRLEQHRWEFDDLYRLLAMDYQLGAAPIVPAPNKILGFGLSRTSRDFSARDRQLLTLMQFHLAQAYSNAKSFARGADSVSSAVAAEFNMTKKESEVAFWISQGKTNAEAALILGISTRTVEKHVERVLKKLHVENRVAATLCVLGLQRPASRHQTWRIDSRLEDPMLKLP